MDIHGKQNQKLIKKNIDNVTIFEDNQFVLEVISGNYVTVCEKGYTFTATMHKHSFYELHFVTEGICHFETETGEILTVSAGEFLIFSPETKHKIIYESERFSKILLFFVLTLKETATPNFYQLAEKIMKKPAVFKANKQMNHFAEAVITNSFEKSYEYMNMIFLSIVSLIIESMRVIVGTKKLVSFKKGSDNRVNSAIKYIKTNISATLSVKDVADSLHISSKQLVRIFKNEIGITPSAYINNYKIECINELLVKNLYINDIVDIMGYSDASTLIKAYKRAEGTTPARFKKSITQND